MWHYNTQKCEDYKTLVAQNDSRRPESKIEIDHRLSMIQDHEKHEGNEEEQDQDHVRRAKEMPGDCSRGAVCWIAVRASASSFSSTVTRISSCRCRAVAEVCDTSTAEAARVGGWVG